MWIKICGTTTLEDALLAAEDGADALGFIFAPSPRRVSVETVASIVSHVPPRMELYGVFVDPEFDEVVSAIEACRLTGAQLHRSQEHRGRHPGLPQRLRDHFAARGQKLKILHAVRWQAARAGDSGDADLAGVIAARTAGDRFDAASDALLVDPSHGTGASFDWSAAQSDFLRASRSVRMIVAGGLTADNVGAAISLLRPWGVDVTSGVERAPGRKDRAKLAAFLRNARRAAEEAADDNLVAADKRP